MELWNHHVNDFSFISIFILSYSPFSIHGTPNLSFLNAAAFKIMSMSFFIFKTIIVCQLFVF